MKTMKFGELIRKRREQLGLTQQEVEGVDQGTLSKIERGRQNPTRREIIEELARALHFQDDKIDWLWMYSLLDREPCEYLLSLSQPPPKEDTESLMIYTNETAAHYTTELAIDLNASEEEVLSIMGPPDKRMRIPSRIKWIYQTEGVHVIFAND